MGSICSRNETEMKKPNAVIKTTTAVLDDAENMTEEFLLALDTKKDQDSPSQQVSDQFVSGLDYPLEVSRRHTLTFNPQVRIDFSKQDYRAFCLLIHRIQGGVLLHCTRKKKKPPHYQLPGGHVDSFEFKQISRSLSNFVTQEQLYHAARMGCVREVYEETGIDFRKRMEDFLPMILYNVKQGELKDETLINEYKSRIFFVCEVYDTDFPSPQEDGSMKYSQTRFPSLSKDYSCDLMLQLSTEHSGFRFVKESSEISNSVKLHSGGKVENAIRMAYNLPYP